MTFDPFSVSGPRWYAIAAHRPFLEDLAAGVLDWLSGRPPEELSDATILLPNRRASRAFTAALSKLSADTPVLLPQVRPLGDLEEDEPPFTPGALGLDLPPAIPALTRRFELAKLIVENFDSTLRPVQALDLADALGRFLDSCQLEEVKDPGLVAGLVEGDMAEHWQRSAEFLSLGVEKWPKRLAEMGLVDPSWRKATLLRRLAELWDREPPQQPLIVAGSTGTVPAAADVMGAVARSPQGCVVLPGLDLDLDEAVWNQISEENEQHPQRALKRLLERHRVKRAQVREWHRPVLSEETIQQGMARQRLLNEALRPADATGDWRHAIKDIRIRAADTGRDPISEGLKGLSILPLRHEEEASAAIALMMRETLNTPGKTCALVTPDQELGRRVQARLSRWGIVADASAGLPLNRMEAGTLLELAVRWIEKPANPQTLLGLLKHPLVALEGDDTEYLATSLERYGLRTTEHGDLTKLKDYLRNDKPRGNLSPEDQAKYEQRTLNLVAFVDQLEAINALGSSAFATNGKARLDNASRALTAVIEALAGQNAWGGPDGEQAAALLSNLIQGGSALGEVTASDMVEMVQGLLADTVVRVGGATHPSLRILGAIEARLVRADLMILAGLEEGIWPQGAPVDPFLSRPMRKALGLPPPERRIGQSAQDFVQAACAPQSILVHCERRRGQPAVRSRWLWRLDMLTRGADSEATPVKIDTPTHVAEWTRTVDAPLRDTPSYAKRPRPTPPVSVRPRELPVTSVERWVRDPYAIYAQRILGLRKLDRPGEPAEAMKRGTAIHNAIEKAVTDHPYDLPDDFEHLLAGLIQDELRHQGFEDAAMAREVPLSRISARWLANFERERRARGIKILVEQSGKLTFDGPVGPFTVTAKADRIEMDAQGAAIIDFKTGRYPKRKELEAGFAPQLPLTGAIVAMGGFDCQPTLPNELTYVRVTGRGEGGEMDDVGASTKKYPAGPSELSQTEFDRLKEAVAIYDDPSRPYVSWEAPQFMGNFGGNYDHLARVYEWMVVGGADGEGEGE